MFTRSCSTRRSSHLDRLRTAILDRAEEVEERHVFELFVRMSQDAGHARIRRKLLSDRFLPALREYLQRRISPTLTISPHTGNTGGPYQVLVNSSRNVMPVSHSLFG